MVQMLFSISALTLAVQASSKLNPSSTAALLENIEEEWVNFAEASDKQQGEMEMVASCSKIANSIVSAADGDKDRVVEYFGQVCADSENCKIFANSLTTFLSDNVEMNREELDMNVFCKRFWSTPGNLDFIRTTTEKKRIMKAQNEKMQAEMEHKKVLEKEKSEKLEKEKKMQLDALKHDSEKTNQTNQNVQSAWKKGIEKKQPIMATYMSLFWKKINEFGTDVMHLFVKFAPNLKVSRVKTVSDAFDKMDDKTKYRINSTQSHSQEPKKPVKTEENVKPHSYFKHTSINIADQQERSIKKTSSGTNLKFLFPHGKVSFLQEKARIEKVQEYTQRINSKIPK